MASSSTCQSRMPLPSNDLSSTIRSKKEMPPSRPMTVPSWLHTRSPPPTANASNTTAGSLFTPACNRKKRRASRPRNTAPTPSGSCARSGSDDHSRASKTADTAFFGGVSFKNSGFRISMMFGFPLAACPRFSAFQTAFVFHI